MTLNPYPHPRPHRSFKSSSQSASSHMCGLHTLIPSSRPPTHSLQFWTVQLSVTPISGYPLLGWCLPSAYPHLSPHARSRNASRCITRRGWCWPKFVAQRNCMVRTAFGSWYRLTGGSVRKPGGGSKVRHARHINLPSGGLDCMADTPEAEEELQTLTCVHLRAACFARFVPATQSAQPPRRPPVAHGQLHSTTYEDARCQP